MMKTFSDIQNVIRDNMAELQRRFGVTKIGIFGSRVRGEQREDSDLDMLVEVNRPMGMIKFVQMEQHLSGITGIRVELFTKGSLKPFSGKRILEEVRYV